MYLRKLDSEGEKRGRRKLQEDVGDAIGSKCKDVPEKLGASVYCMWRNQERYFLYFSERDKG